MHGVQPATLDSGPYAAGAQPELDELRLRHHSVLSSGELRDLRVEEVC